MLLRPYQPDDCAVLARLFAQTIQCVTCPDYSQAERDAWAAGWHTLTDAFFGSRYTLVAVKDDQVAGYANLDDTGYLDHLFVHKDFQRRHVATALCDALEQYAHSRGLLRVTVHASLTAKPFFLRRGYVLLRAQSVPLRGQHLTNFVMEKNLNPEHTKTSSDT